MNKNAVDPKNTFLYEAALTISAKLETDEVLQRLMILTHAYFLPDAVSVALVNPDGTLEFRAASGKSAQQIIGMPLKRGTGIVGWVAEHGEGVWVPDVYKDPRFYSGTDKNTGFKTTAILAVPVKLGDQTLAIVEMINPTPETDLREAKEMMTALALLVAPAIHNAQAIEQLRRSEARYRGLFERNPDPVIVLGSTGLVLEGNTAAQKLFNFSPETAPASGLDDTILGAQAFDHLKAIVAAQEKATWQIKVQMPDTDERVLDVCLTHLPDYGPDGAYQWLAHGVTDAAMLTDVYWHLFRTIAHDLRVPLGNITNTLEMTLAAWQDNNRTLPIVQVLSIGLRSAQRMARLISNIQDVGRFTTDGTLDIAPIHVGEMVTDVVEAVRSTVEQRSHTIVQQVPDDVPSLLGDVDRVFRVLFNIVDNAVRYSPDGSIITLTVSADDTDVRFAVTDTGPGIPPEDQASIFEIFPHIQGHKPRGAGVGLAYCKLAIEAHGGQIGVQSEVGHGSTFYFTIPRQLPERVLQIAERGDD